MISLLERDELDRVMKVLDDAGVVDRDGGLKLSASERVRRVLSELRRSKTSSKQQTHSCDLPALSRCEIKCRGCWGCWG
jgi:hypothetical protein